MSDESKSASDREKTRLCPTCRCAISVLATKCRFCGESVGRPKDETRNLTIEDLGGETVVHYAPSSNVMEALEAFRTEEVVTPDNQPQAKKKTLFGRKAGGAGSNGPQKTGIALPELDERSKALASLMTPTGRPTQSTSVAKPTWMKKMAFLGGFVAAVVILYFGSIQAAAIIRNFGAEEQVKPVYVNRAPDMMQAGAPVLEIHQEALLAFQKDESVANRDILAQARQKVTDDIRALLNAPTVTVQNLREASNRAYQAWNLDRSPEMQALKEEADAENIAYGMNVVEFNTKSNPPTAVIQLYDKSRVTVKVNDTIRDRFLVQTITPRYVRLIDTQRKTPSGTNRSLQLDTEGIPK